MASSVIHDELKWFHLIDRKIFTRLLNNVSREVKESRRIIALWLWMEAFGFPNLVMKLVQVEEDVLKAATEEAVNCLEYMEETYRPVTEILTVTSLVLGKQVTFNYFDANRDHALSTVWKTANNVFTWVFDDLVPVAGNVVGGAGRGDGNVVGGAGNIVGGAGRGDGNVVGGAGNIVGGAGIGEGNVVGEAWNIVGGAENVVGGAWNIVGGVENVVGGAWNIVGGAGRGGNLVGGAGRGGNLVGEADNIVGGGAAAERTIYFSFSRGFYVFEREIREFFESAFGDCIEEIQVQDITSPYFQPFASKVVFQNPIAVPLVLGEETKRMLSINGKFVLMYKK